MSELRRQLDEGARQISAREGARENVIRRVERRRRLRRVGGAVLALAIAGGGIGLAVATFRPTEGSVPAAGPTPGPTPTSDDATPDPVSVQIDDATTVPGAAEYAVPLLASEGRGMRHGGYRVEAIIRDGEGSELTVLFFDPRYEVEAERLRDLFFPGAEIRAEVTGDPIAVRIVLGEDFASNWGEEIDQLRAARQFMWARVRGDEARASEHLSAAAAAQYDSHEGGLDLLRYTEGAIFHVNGILLENGTQKIGFRIADSQGGSSAHELLTLGRKPNTMRTFEVISAERIA